MNDPSSATLEPMVKKLSYWASFDDGDRSALLGLPHQIKNLERNGYIVRELDQPTHSCVLLSGISVRHKIVLSGGRQIVAVQMQGDIVDLQNSFLGMADHSVQVLTDSQVAFIPREAVKNWPLNARPWDWQCGSIAWSMLRCFGNG